METSRRGQVRAVLLKPSSKRLKAVIVCEIAPYNQIVICCKGYNEEQRNRTGCSLLKAEVAKFALN